MRNKVLPLVLLGLCQVAVMAEKKPLEWVGTWAASPMNMSMRSDQPSPSDHTYRNVVHISLGGKTLRVQLTNEFGNEPLTIGAAHVALSAETGSIKPNSDHVLNFGGRPSVTIPAGGMVLSDPLPMEVAPFSDLAVSVYLPQQSIEAPTCHALGSSTNFITQGDTTADVTLQAAKSIYSWCFLKGIDIQPKDKSSAAIVTLGDSITDGAKSTRDANHRWPDILAQRLQADKKTAKLAILNEGISGNRVLHDQAGPNAISRFDRDVLSESGVKYLIILESINDIGHATQLKNPSDIVSAQDLIFGMQQMIFRAHQHNIKVFGATLTPYEGAGYFSAEGERIRQALNSWIRTSGNFDGVIDFDKITRDPSSPTMFLPAYDCGDHLHPNDAGYKAMAEAIDLSIFR
jgi:lysophospholipase L1-like esterase